MAIDARSIRRSSVALTSAVLAGLLAVSSVIASTPVTNGYRDQSYGGGASRPSADKPQSKVWYTDGTWFAGMFLYQVAPATPKSEFRIYALNESTHAWVDKGTVVDTRDQTHADYLWDEASQTLIVASTSPMPGTLPTTTVDDGIKVFKYTYDASTNVYAAVAGFPKGIPGTASVANTTRGGAPTVTIARDSTGNLFTVWPRDGEVRYSHSTDGGVTWATPAPIPAQVGNPIKSSVTNESNDTASVVAFGSNIGVMWSDHAGTSAADQGFYFAIIAAGADPTVGGNWSLEQLPTLVVASPGEIADNHVNLRTTSDGSVYMVGKTGKDTLNCATNLDKPLIEFFARTPGGSWSTNLVGTVGDCNTRPQIQISEELDTAYVFLTAPNGGGVVYRKSAPLSGPEAYKFRGTADSTIQPGTPVIQSATELKIDDASTTKQVVTSATGIVILASNIVAPKYYFHAEMALAATDSTPPAGTVTINAGAAWVNTTAVSVAVPATDGGSGVSLVRLSNSAAVNGSGVLSSGTSFTYGTPIGWTLSSGDGTKTVYAQWRDSAGNWSAVTSDTIVLDTSAPTGTVEINGGDVTTENSAVTLNLTADDGAGSGVTSVLISNSTDFTGVTPKTYAAALPWTLAAGGGTKTVYVKFTDAAGNTSASPVSDTIDMIGMPFTDVTSFRTQIAWLYAQGITGGCSATKFCPTAPVTRAQMAMFLVRALDLPSAPPGTDYFDDDDGKTGESSINALAESGITGGCGPRRYCPTASVTRAQMAMFLVRALDLPSAPPGTDYFDDDDGKTGESSINALAESGITGGCGPRRYCPTQPVTRGQMAAFLYRALAP